MLAIALLSSICLQAHAEVAKKVDVRLRAAIGEVMVERLGELFAVEISAHSSIAEEPFIFNVLGVTFEEFRELSARGLDASWRKNKRGWELFRSREQIDEELQRFYDYRKLLLRKEMTRNVPPDPVSDERITEWARSMLVAAFEGGEDSQLYPWNSTLFPRQQVMPRIWHALGIELLSAIPLDERWVFTADGVHGTHRLPELARAKQMILALRPRLLHALKRNGAWDMRSSLSFGVGIKDLPSTPVDKVFLEVTSYWDYITMSLVGFDESGKRVVNFYDASKVWLPTPGQVQRSIKNVTIPQSKASRKIAGDFAKLGIRESGPSTYLWDLLSSMPRSEPLALDVSDLLLAMSDELNLPLVARLSNDLLDALGLALLDKPDIVTEGVIDLKSGIDWIETLLDLEETAEGLIKGSPARPPQYQLAFPRKAIADYVRNNRATKVLDLQRIPPLVRRPGSAYDPSIVDLVFFVHGPEHVSSASLSALFAWQSLSSEAKQMSLTPQGVTVPFKSLGNPFHASVRGVILWNAWWHGIGRFDPLRRQESYTYLDFLPFDITKSTLLDVLVQVRASAVPSVHMFSPLIGDQELIDPETWAEYFLTAEKSNRVDEENKIASAKFRVERALRVEVSFETPVGTHTWISTVELTADNPERLSLDQLPVSWLAKFRRALQALRDKGRRSDTARVESSELRN